MAMRAPNPLFLATGVVLVLVALGLVLTAPPGVPVSGALVQLGILVGAVGVGSAGLFAMTTDPGDPQRWTRVLRSTAVIVLLVSVGGGIRAGVDLRSAKQLSVDLLADAPQYGPGAVMLRSNLENAQVVAPNRPHNPTDITSGDRLERVQRTRTFFVNTNSAGFRGPEFRSPAPPFRIAWVGDSMTFGWGMADSQAWPAVLGQLLDQDVLNLGVPAGEAEMLTRMVEQRIRALDVDVVLFSEWPEFMKPNHWPAFQDQLQRLRRAAEPAKFAVVLPPVSTFDPVRLAVKEGAVQRIRNMAKGIPVLDLGQTFTAGQTQGVILRTTGNTQDLLQLPDRTVIATGQSTPDRIAPEIIQVFENDSTVFEPLFFDGGHPTVEGNQLAAQTVARWLDSMGWLPQG